jgi:hypothetical protein
MENNKNTNNICEFCKKSFSAKSSLTLHQKTAKYCFQIRGEESSSEFSCDFCKKTFTNNHRLVSHQKTCKERQLKESKKDLILNLQRQVKLLTKQLKEEQILNKTLKKDLEQLSKI